MSGLIGEQPLHELDPGPDYLMHGEICDGSPPG